MKPVPMPMRLMMTWMAVKVAKLIPRTMGISSLVGIEAVFGERCRLWRRNN
jgi:hypothetical protein